jgi:hypothetical protein
MTPSPAPAPSPAESLWRQYNSFLSLYRFYISSLIKLNTLHYAVAGAILSFYLLHSNTPALRLALALPLVFSITLVILFGWGTARAKDMTQAFHQLTDKLSAIQAATPFRPATETLYGLLWVFLVLQTLTAAGLAALLFNLVPLPPP